VVLVCFGYAGCVVSVYLHQKQLKDKLKQKESTIHLVQLVCV